MFSHKVPWVVFISTNHSVQCTRCHEIETFVKLPATVEELLKRTNEIIEKHKNCKEVSCARL